MVLSRYSWLVAVLFVAATGCSTEDKAQRLAVSWLEQSGGECPAPVLEIGATEFVEPIGSVSQWILLCGDDSRYPIKITRMPRSLEQYKDQPALYEVLKEGVQDGETLADGVHIIMFGARGLVDRMYGGDWPLGDYPPIFD